MYPFDISIDDNMNASTSEPVFNIMNFGARDMVGDPLEKFFYGLGLVTPPPACQREDGFPASWEWFINKFHIIIDFAKKKKKC